MTPDLLSAEGYVCLMQGDGSDRTVWILEDAFEIFDKQAQMHSKKKLLRQLRFITDLGLQRLKPPTYVAYDQHSVNDVVFVMGRIAANEIRAYGFPYGVGIEQLYIITAVDPKKRKKKRNERIYKRAVAMATLLAEKTNNG